MVSAWKQWFAILCNYTRLIQTYKLKINFIPTFQPFSLTHTKIFPNPMCFLLETFESPWSVTSSRFFAMTAYQTQVKKSHFCTQLKCTLDFLKDEETQFNKNLYTNCVLLSVLYKQHRGKIKITGCGDMLKAGLHFAPHITARTWQNCEPFPRGLLGKITFFLWNCAASSFHEISYKLKRWILNGS